MSGALGLGGRAGAGGARAGDAAGLGRAQPCPCGSARAYGACCAPLVVDGQPAGTAEALMRSRYVAHVLGATEHLTRTWHPRTRLDRVAPAEHLVWEGLEVLGVAGGGPDDDHGVVEFRARWRSGVGRTLQRGAMHERSRFTRRAGRWVYVDGAEPRA